MTSSRLRAVVLAIAASLLAGCATERSDGAPCPPVVAYSRDFLARAAGELDLLPAGSAIEQMLADYQVMRDQARVCEHEHNWESTQGNHMGTHVRSMRSRQSSE